MKTWKKHDSANILTHPARPWLDRVLMLLGLALVLAALTDTFAEPDLWGYLCFGKLFWRNPGFPWQDAFSYAPTHEVWVFHEWLTGVLFFRLNEVVGAAGLQTLKYGLGAASAVLVFAAARQRGAPAALAVLPVFFLGGFFSWAFPAVRALVFTYFFFTLFLLALETADHAGPRGLPWVLPPMMFLWANLHGGFLAGLGLILLYALGRMADRRSSAHYWMALAACFAVTILNPYGPGLWKAVFSHLANPQEGIREWVSVPGAMARFGASLDLLIFVSALGCGLFLLILAGRPRIQTVLVLAGTALAGLVHHRHMPFYIFSLAVFAPSMALRAAARVRTQWRRPMILAGAAGFCLAAGAALWFNASYMTAKIPFILQGGNPLALKTPGEPYDPNLDALFYPVGAVDYLEKSKFSGNILPYATWGGYISWRLHPRCRVGMDLRFETVYPQEVRREYFDFLRCGPGWRMFLDEYPHDAILINAGGALHRAVEALPQWRTLYQDRFTVLFGRVRERERHGIQQPAS